MKRKTVKMSKFLFNNKAFPIIAQPEDAAVLLDNGQIRAISYRSDDVLAVMKAVNAGGVNFSHNPHNSAAFLPDKNGDRTRFPGERPYYRPVTAEDIQREAQESGVLVRPELIGTLAATMNSLKAMFTQTYRAYSGDQETPIVGHILVVQKGMPARAAAPHIDDVVLTGHWSSAPLDILTEEPDEVLWEALDKIRRSAMPPDEQAKVLRWLEKNVPEWQDNYMYSNPGDFLIMKGQKGKDLSRREDQQQVCPHKSSALLPALGQVGFVCFPKEKTPELDLH